MKPALTLPPALQGFRQAAQQRWSTLAPRERLGLGLSALVLLLFLTWMFGVQPALKTLRTAPAQRLQLDAQLAQMQQLAAEAAELRAQPPVAPTQAEAALKSATDQIGPAARLQRSGERVTVTFTGIEPGALTNWLNEVRSAARARVVEAQLARAGAGYNGSVVLTLEAPR